MTDTHDILKAIGDLGSRMERRFEAVETRLDGMDRRLDGIDKRLDGIDKRFDQMDHRFEKMQETAAAQGERITRMEGRLDEQSRILAALIPTRIAAVPPAAE